jgi:hypothetical protein
MLRVPGLARVTLNGHLLPMPPLTDDAVELRDIELLERNELVLEVHVPAQFRLDSGETPSWGEIALVVHARAPGELEPLA